MVSESESTADLHGCCYALKFMLFSFEISRCLFHTTIYWMWDEWPCGMWPCALHCTGRNCKHWLNIGWATARCQFGMFTLALDFRLTERQTKNGAFYIQDNDELCNQLLSYLSVWHFCNKNLYDSSCKEAIWWYHRHANQATTGPGRATIGN